MNIKPKHWQRLYSGEKLPRKIKKAILGTKPTRKALKERIAKVTLETIHPYPHNSYEFVYPDDTFCPYCGCDYVRSTGNMAGYPEEWIKGYCLRCGEEVSKSDNGMVWHALMDFKEVAP